MESKQEIAWPVSKVRQMFVDFFKSKEHTFVPSSPVVPVDDPTLLFANSGMNQFKPIFLGLVDPKSHLATLKRAANSQKCIRAGGKHNDLEDVGKDTYHHTFFEMLGNWSFGDYFKKEAIDWAWELLTQCYGLDPARLYVTYFGGNAALKLPADEEARELWLRYLPTEKVLPYGMKENFWEMGDTGPCGPCSEIHFDRIGGRDVAALVNADDPTVIEIWNLVFMQFNREPDGSLRPLPAKHVDTGMGLERVTSILQGVMSNYDSDVFMPIFGAIQKETGARAYTAKVGAEDTDNVDMAYRVVADHIRTLTFALADGASVSNEGRGYVLKRILRRGVRYGSEILGGKPGFFSKLVPSVLDSMAYFYPEIKAKYDTIVAIIKEEEEVFGRTLQKGIALFHKVSEKAKETKVFSGDDAFQLYDTFGFPVDLTELMANEKGFRVDMERFKERMEQARETSRSIKTQAEVSLELGVEATAYLQKAGVAPTDDLPKFAAEPIQASIKAIFVGGPGATGFVESVDGPKTVGIVFDKTNFYAEMGGQIFDIGSATSGEVEFEITEVQSYAAFVLHTGILKKGSVRIGDSLQLTINAERRLPIMSNHTFTHTLNFALREALKGCQVDQKGSLVDASKLRFDFSLNRAMTLAEIAQVDSICNEAIAKALPVYAREVPLDQAQKINGLRAVFGEVYPNPVRVVSVGRPVEDLLADPTNAEWMTLAIELCGGTHLSNTSQAVKFVVMSEAGIAKGIRRIVAWTGKAAQEAVDSALRLKAEIAKALELKGDALDAEINRLSTALDAQEVPAVLKAELQELMKKLFAEKQSGKKDALKNVLSLAEELARKAGAEAKIIAEEVPAGGDAKTLDAAVRAVRAGCPNAAILLITKDGKKAFVQASVPASLTSKMSASDWVKDVAVIVGGKGGGKPESAMASGSDVDKVADALQRSLTFASEKLA
eukprot:TRINITY_DN317_c0_g1_i1.p1 TRINITY_DN317_c0_g1~~TRINITY_DN317_c0_g1_i1.p1  ORF type:complete len:947 (-),score=399.22 TRINITY_DN317_c0_g1_i1:219-3059(-)